jgi:hypothetical protein
MPDEFEVAVDIAVPPRVAWDVIRDPSAIPRWYPIYVRSHPARDMRILERLDGALIQERFLAKDEAAMTLVTTVLSGLPYAEYGCEWRVTPAGDGCRVTWRTRAVPDDPSIAVDDWLEREHVAALEGLKALLEAG